MSSAVRVSEAPRSGLSEAGKLVKPSSVGAAVVAAATAGSAAAGVFSPAAGEEPPSPVPEKFSLRTAVCRDNTELPSHVDIAEPVSAAPSLPVGSVDVAMAGICAPAGKVLDSDPAGRLPLPRFAVCLHQRVAKKM